MPNNNQIEKEFSEKLKRGLEIAEKKMLEDKAMRGECIIVSTDGKTFQRISAKQLVNNSSSHQSATLGFTTTS